MHFTVVRNALKRFELEGHLVVCLLIFEFVHFYCTKKKESWWINEYAFRVRNISENDITGWQAPSWSNRSIFNSDKSRKYMMRIRWHTFYHIRLIKHCEIQFDDCGSRPKHTQRLLCLMYSFPFDMASIRSQHSRMIGIVLRIFDCVWRFCECEPGHEPSTQCMKKLEDHPWNVC